MQMLVVSSESSKATIESNLRGFQSRRGGCLLVLSYDTARIYRALVRPACTQRGPCLEHLLVSPCAFGLSHPELCGAPATMHAFSATARALRPARMRRGSQAEEQEDSALCAAGSRPLGLLVTRLLHCPVPAIPELVGSRPATADSALFTIRSTMRIMVTGTPVQNGRASSRRQRRPSQLSDRCAPMARLTAVASTCLPRGMRCAPCGGRPRGVPRPTRLLHSGLPGHPQGV